MRPCAAAPLAGFTGRDPVRFGLAALCLALLYGCAAPPANDRVVVPIDVDLARDVGPMTHCASGILSGLSPTQPADALLGPLRIRHWRAGGGALRPEMVARTTSYGMRVQLVLADTWGYSNPKHGWPGDNGDWATWESHVTAVAGRVRDHGIHIAWDIWNEPGPGGFFWKPDRERYHEMWRRTVRVIRQVDPHAEIVGPSYASFDMDALRDFLLAAQRADVVPDTLSWHELDRPDASAIPSHVARIRRFMADHRIDVRRISINEVMPCSHVVHPGVAVSYFANLERAGVDSACRSCWSDGACVGCDEGSLDSLLTCDGREPRAVWWAYKAYAELAGRRVAVRVPDGESIDAIATHDPADGTTRILLGRFDDTRPLRQWTPWKKDWTLFCVPARVRGEHGDAFGVRAYYGDGGAARTGIAVTPGARYRLRVRMRTRQAVRDDPPDAEATWAEWGYDLDNRGPDAAAPDYAITWWDHRPKTDASPDGAWTTFESPIFTATGPAVSVWLRAGCKAEGGGILACFDDVELECVGADDTRHARLVEGFEAPAWRDIDARMTLRGLTAAKRLTPVASVRVVAERIPYVDTSALPAPTRIVDEVREARSDAVRIDLPAIGPHDACFVLVSPLR